MPIERKIAPQRTVSIGVSGAVPAIPQTVDVAVMEPEDRVPRCPWHAAHVRSVSDKHVDIAVNPPLNISAKTERDTFYVEIPPGKRIKI